MKCKIRLYQAFGTYQWRASVECYNKVIKSFVQSDSPGKAYQYTDIVAEASLHAYNCGFTEIQFIKPKELL